MERAMKFSVVQFVHFCVVSQFIGRVNPLLFHQIPNILMVYTYLHAFQYICMFCCRCYTLAAVTIFAEGFDKRDLLNACVEASLPSWMLSFATHRQNKPNVTYNNKNSAQFSNLLFVYSHFFHFFF